MEEVSWDPLETQLSTDIVSATLKRQIKNILKSYTGWFDPLSELIQNALDAIDHRKRTGDSFIAKIWIKIDLKENSISVTDNGIGFSEDQFKGFLAPNVSFKKQADRGNKGVGATYLAYGFNYLQIGTKNPEFSYIGTIKNGRDWVEDESGTITRPKVIRSSLIHDVFDSIDQGSTFTLKFVGTNIRPKDLTWVGAENANQWDIVLRIKTPLGGIYFKEGCLLNSCRLIVVDSVGNTTEKEIVDVQYVYPHSVISTCKQLKEVRQKTQELIAKGRDPSRLPDSFYGLNGLFNYWNFSDFLSEEGEFSRVLDDREREISLKYKFYIYAFFGYSTDIWDKFNDDVVALRKGTRILRGGIQMATNCMPQGDLVTIPLTKNIGYQNVTHIVIHFEEAEPDLGRKGFQPELIDLAKHISTSIVPKFTYWRKLLKKETGAPPDIIEITNIHDWIRNQEKHEEESPLIIQRKDVFLPITEPALTSSPLNEQDVISLFNQLLAGGVIRGIKILSTSQHQQYDGVFRFWLKKPFSNHIFDKERNPLGIESSKVTQEYLSPPLILEYKYSFDGLLEELEKGEKNERNIGLVIAWEMGENWAKRYDVTTLLHFDNLHLRDFHGATHLIKNSETGQHVFPAIILSELIEYINNPDGVQATQKEKYMD